MAKKSHLIAVSRLPSRLPRDGSYVYTAVCGELCSREAVETVFHHHTYFGEKACPPVTCGACRREWERRTSQSSKRRAARQQRRQQHRSAPVASTPAPLKDLDAMPGHLDVFGEPYCGLVGARVTRDVKVIHSSCAKCSVLLDQLLEQGEAHVHGKRVVLRHESYGWFLKGRS